MVRAAVRCATDGAEGLAAKRFTLAKDATLPISDCKERTALLEQSKRRILNCIAYEAFVRLGGL